MEYKSSAFLPSLDHLDSFLVQIHTASLSENTSKHEHIFLILPLVFFSVKERILSRWLELWVHMGVTQAALKESDAGASPRTRLVGISVVGPTLVRFDSSFFVPPV